MRRPLVVANWKMHGTLGFVQEYASGLAAVDGVDVVLCPPSVFLAAVVTVCDASSTSVTVGAQDVGTQQSGAHTGELSAAMLADVGARWVIVGHSERRADQGESDALVAQKAEACGTAGLIPIVCVGETLAQRESGEARAVVEQQLQPVLAAAPAELVIAYEPVWAIGTGQTATPDQAQDMHAHIRALLPDPAVRVIYGGSVKSDNAAELFAQTDIDGALVGGASLDPSQFFAIATAAVP